MTVINFSNASFSACNYFMLLSYAYTISAHEMKLSGLLAFVLLLLFSLTTDVNATFFMYN